MMAGLMEQTAPWPTELEEIVHRLRYRDGWVFDLRHMERDPETSHGASAGGLTFVVATDTVNAYRQQDRVRVNHYFIVPAATYNRRSWLRWVFDCVCRVELHEAMEFFALVREGEEGTIDARWDRPFALTHGPGDDPYVVHEYATEIQSRIRFTGEVLET